MLNQAGRCVVHYIGGSFRQGGQVAAGSGALRYHALSGRSTERPNLRHGYESVRRGEDRATDLDLRSRNATKRGHI